MRCGKLRSPVYVQARTMTRNSYGEPEEVWDDPGELRWARIEPLTGREAIWGKQVESTVSHRVRMRYWSSVTPEYRLVTAVDPAVARVLNIVSVSNIDDRGAEMELLCIEVTA